MRNSRCQSRPARSPRHSARRASMVAMVLSMSSTSTLSVSSSLSWPEGAPCDGQHARHVVHKAGAAELAGADVHGHGQVAAQGVVLPAGQQGAGVCAAPSGPAAGSGPVSSARAMKSDGEHHAALRRGSSAAALPRPQSRRFGAPGAGSAAKTRLAPGLRAGRPPALRAPSPRPASAGQRTAGCCALQLWPGTWPGRPA